MRHERAYVYVLKLQAGNWYVGSTSNIEARVCEHFAGQGALWTQKYPPISVAEVTECLTGDPLPLERAKSAEMAMKYGWSRVRGAGHVKVEASQPAWFDLEGKRRKYAKPKSTPPSFLDQDPQEEDGVLCQNADESQDNEELATTVVTLDTKGIWED